MEKTLIVLNDLVNRGLIRGYAIGGAMGATFYLEPLLTFDLDVFVELPTSQSGLLTLSPLYEHLRSRAYREEGECVNIEGTPVQFLPAYNALVEEAVKEARRTKFEATSTRVLTPEYLVAIAVQTGRAKDRDRVRLFREQTKLDMVRLRSILERHGLTARWNEWTQP